MGYHQSYKFCGELSAQWSGILHLLNEVMIIIFLVSAALPCRPVRTGFEQVIISLLLSDPGLHVRLVSFLHAACSDVVCDLDGSELPLYGVFRRKSLQLPKNET